MGAPIEAVDFRKQRKICDAATYFLHCNHMYLDRQMRFDVIGILGDELTHYANAFAYCGKSFI